MLFDLVCEHLNLLEKDYFGLTFCDADSQKVSVLGWGRAGKRRLLSGTPLVLGLPSPDHTLCFLSVLRSSLGTFCLHIAKTHLALSVSVLCLYRSHLALSWGPASHSPDGCLESRGLTSWGNETLTAASLFHPWEAPVWVSSFPPVPQSPTPLTHGGARLRAQGPKPCGESQPYSPHFQFQRVQTAWPEKGVPCLGLLTGYCGMSLSHSPIWPSPPSSL